MDNGQWTVDNGRWIMEREPWRGGAVRVGHFAKLPVCFPGGYGKEAARELQPA